MLSRRELLKKGAAVAGPAMVLGRVPGARAATSARAAGRRPPTAGLNVVIFITDQERAIQHFPAGWTERSLPGLTRLQRNGLTFENAFCNACMCSPSRATLMTGCFPAQHGVKYTLEQDMPDDQYPQVALPRGFANIASVMAASGYTVAYKGKWHLSKPAGTQFAPADVAGYGFARWNPPDAGANQDVDQEGGGTDDNDGRYMSSTGDATAGDEGVLQYLGSVAAAQQPFCLIVSLVNPHDVLLYPRHFDDGGYDESWLEGEIELPETVFEDLSSKPTAQREFLRLFNLTGPLVTPRRKRAYINFYANLMKASDAHLVQVLDALDAQGLRDSTLVIRTSDHGEMGLAHDGMRQKNFNFYEETLRVPLVYSNPRLWPRPRSSRVMVSHVDLLPTLAGLVGAPRSARGRWQGIDYSDHVLDRAAPPPQDHIVFTYDDWQAGQAGGLYVRPPQHIVSLREERWKIAEYYDAAGHVPSQWEMYDLRADPLERDNLAHRGAYRTPAQEKQYRRLRRKLARVRRERLRPLPDTPQPQTQGSTRRIAPASATD